MIRVFRAERRDMAHITNLDLMTQEFAMDMDVAKSYFTCKSGAAYLSQVGGKSIAYATAMFDQFTNTVTIESIGTHPEFRRVGVSRKLLDKISLAAHAGGLRKVAMSLPCYLVEDKEDPWYIEEWLWKLNFKAIGSVRDGIRRYNKNFDLHIFERMS